MHQLERGHPLHRRATLRVGDLDLTVRPVLPTDALGIADLVAGVSERSRYLRFHAAVVRLNAAQLGSIVDVDHHTSETLVATVPRRRRGSGRIVGFGQYVQAGPGLVDLSLLVHDDLQGRGIGRVLATRLVAAAAESGYTDAEATILAENQRMLALARHLPDVTMSRPSGAVVLSHVDLVRNPAVPAPVPAGLS